jgi:glyoxylase-like metal-dependent hydrolase (beta-lactamase superfamily II)
MIVNIIKTRGHGATYATVFILLFAVALSSSWSCQSQQRGKKKNMVLIRLIVGPLQVNCFILADEKTKDAIVIDPGDDAQEVLKIIRDKGLKVRYIVNTHGHFDHVGANKAVKEATGAELLIHEGDAPVMASAPKHSLAFGMHPVSSPPADRYVKHGDVITAGEVSLKVLHTPGHSPGGICLREEGMVFTGDALFAGSIGRTDLPGGDLMTLIRSIKTHLMTLPDDTKVFSGHGPASTIGDERLENPFLNKESGFE